MVQTCEAAPAISDCVLSICAMMRSSSTSRCSHSSSRSSKSCQGKPTASMSVFSQSHKDAPNTECPVLKILSSGKGTVSCGSIFHSHPGSRTGHPPTQRPHTSNFRSSKSCLGKKVQLLVDPAYKVTRLLTNILFSRTDAVTVLIFVWNALA